MKNNPKIPTYNCELCGERKNTKYNTCGYRLCPYVMENLTELLESNKFRESVENAEDCTTNLRYTLRYLKKAGAEQITKPDSENTESMVYKSECANCRYAGDGFVCGSKSAKSCLADWVKKAREEKIICET